MNAQTINGADRDFPFVAALPVREKSRLGKLFDVVSAIKAAQEEHGPVVCQSLAADVLGVTQQRVSQFVSEGRLGSVSIGSGRFVFVRSLEAFVSLERPTGRPRKSSLKQHVENVREIGRCAGVEI